MLFIMAAFSQCAVTKKMETNMPFELGDIYYQEWVAGIKGEGSGINIVIPLVSNPKNIVLDSVYFHGKQTKLESRDNMLFVGRFQSEKNQKKNVIMSNEPYAEYGNKVPEIPKKASFQLQENECIVSYKTGNRVKYFKIDKIEKKEILQYMSTPTEKQ